MDYDFSGISDEELDALIDAARGKSLGGYESVLGRDVAAGIDNLMKKVIRVEGDGGALNGTVRDVIKQSPRLQSGRLVNSAVSDVSSGLRQRKYDELAAENAPKNRNGIVAKFLYGDGQKRYDELTANGRPQRTNLLGNDIAYANKDNPALKGIPAPKPQERPRFTKDGRHLTYMDEMHGPSGEQPKPVTRRQRPDELERELDNIPTMVQTSDGMKVAYLHGKNKRFRDANQDDMNEFRGNQDFYRKNGITFED